MSDRLERLAARCHVVEVEYNANRVLYQERREYLDNIGVAVPDGVDDWPSLVMVRVYERTPINYIMAFGPTLDAALDTLGLDGDPPTRNDEGERRCKTNN